MILDFRFEQYFFSKEYIYHKYKYVMYHKIEYICTRIILYDQMISDS
jgi:hypothetical protein